MTTVVLAPQAASARDYADTALNVLPAGQYGSVPPPDGADRQAKMYDGLTPLFNRVTDSDLTRYFKSAALGKAPGATRNEPVPGRPGISIQRDEFNVPHIRGATDDDVAFAVGWVTAQDRGLLIEQARYNARAAAVDAPGLSALELTAQLLNFQPSAQTEAEVAKQAQVLESKGEKGRQVLHDIDVYVAGINAFNRSQGRTSKPWTRTDVFALNALKGQFVGQGGGRETSASMLLSGLRKDLGRKKGQSVFNDLRQRRVKGTPVSVDGKFPYAQIPKRTRGNVIIDNDSFKSTAVDGAPGNPATQASNVIIAGPKRTASGRAILSGGPQIGYFYPGFVLEVDIAGPGYEARGVTTAPFPGYVFIGRREDFGFTLTSAGSDIIDHFVETLCDGSDTKYLYKGECRDMERFDAGKLTGTDGETRPVVFNRTVHGPVIGYANVGGRRVAISRKRASYGRDVEDQLLYHDVTKGRIDGPRDLFRAASQSPQTFNTFYVDRRNIAMYTSGSLPLRAKSVDSGLPVDGRGDYEWRGRLSAGKHPQGINPKSGLIVNWNNKPAAEFPGADDQFGYGTVGRVDLLNGRMDKRRKHTQASIVSALNAAATMDVRQRIVPVLAKVLRTGPAPSARAERMLELLERWRDNGSSRLDVDLDGKIDDPGAAVMDAAYPGMADATIKPLVRGSLANRLSGLFSRFNSPPGGQFNGWYQYMDRDLRKLLRLRVRDPFRNRFCGRGNLTRCRDSLWKAIDEAGDEMAAEQGANPDAWRADATQERIKFRPNLLTTTMRYSNRASGIHQILEFSGHR